jgi:hypothetical protein
LRDGSYFSTKQPQIQSVAFGHRLLRKSARDFLKAALTPSVRTTSVSSASCAMTRAPP